MSSLKAFLSGIIALLCLSQCSHVEQQSCAAQASPIFQIEPNPVIQRQGYTLAYDGRIRGAQWVYEELSENSLQGDADRVDFDFMEDPLIPPSLRATKEDFKGSGFDRGHLCPAADARSSRAVMKETFYLSNITPQAPALNRKLWLKLEKHVRELTKRYDTVQVVTGPLFLPKKGKNGKRYVKYEVIGKNDVAVPTHFFKVLRGKKGAIADTEAFILPNTAVEPDAPLMKFAVALEKVEKAAGVIFKKE